MKIFFLIIVFIPGLAATALACPEYSLPHCEGNARLDVSKDEQGCNVVTCVAVEPNQVDDNYQSIPAAPKVEMAAPEAESNESVVSISPITDPAEAKPEEVVKPEAFPSEAPSPEALPKAEVSAPSSTNAGLPSSAI